MNDKKKEKNGGKNGTYLCSGAENIHICVHMPCIHVLAVATI